MNSSTISPLAGAEATSRTPASEPEILTSVTSGRRIFYVAQFRGTTDEPIAYILRHPGVRRGGTITPEYLETAFAKATGDVYVPVKFDGGAEGGYVDGGYVCVVPTVSGQPWRVFFTVEPMKQGEAYGDEGPLTDRDEALRLAATLEKKTGKAHAVVEFTPGALLEPRKPQ